MLGEAPPKSQAGKVFPTLHAVFTASRGHFEAVLSKASLDRLGRALEPARMPLYGGDLNPRLIAEARMTQADDQVDFSLMLSSRAFVRTVPSVQWRESSHYFLREEAQRTRTTCPSRH